VEIPFGGVPQIVEIPFWWRSANRGIPQSCGFEICPINGIPKIMETLNSGTKVMEFHNTISGNLSGGQVTKYICAAK